MDKEELKQFLKTGKELQVKGLMGELQGLMENDHAKQVTIQNNIFRKKYEANTYENKTSSQMENRTKQNGEGFEDENILSKEDTSDHEEYIPVILKEVDVSNENLEFKIEGIIEKNNGVWKCKICGSIRAHKSHMRDHAETHIEGISHACHICNKNFSTRHKLRSHKGRKH